MPWVAAAAVGGSALVNAFSNKSPQQAAVTSPFGTANTLGALDYARSTNNDALQQQQGFINELQNPARQGYTNQQNVYNQQADLANQLQQQAAGQGPNPAQAQLQQNTAANTANQAALMAGQRGSGANAGLVARQAAMQGGANQQAAAGQAATLQAQQQIAAQQQLAGQQQAMAQLATQQVGQYTSNLNSFNNNALGAQQSAYGAVGGQNQTNATNTANANNANFNNNQATAGMYGAIGSGLATLGGMGSPSKPSITGNSTGTSGLNTSGMAAHGGIMANAYNQGGPVSNVGRMLKAGGPVPGQAKIKGDNSKNDTVHAMLSPGEIVIPRSIATAPDAPAKAAQFIAALRARAK